MSEQPPEGRGPEQPHRLWDAFAAEMGRRAEARAPSSVRGAFERFGWSARDVAERFGVSERTARRWRQQDRVPPRRAAEWRERAKGEQERRTRERLSRRGIKRMQATGKYRVSGNPKYEYKSNPWSPVHLLEGNKITPAQMREIFAAADAGDLAAAEQLLSDALAEGYGMTPGIDGTPGMEWVDVDGIDFDIP